MSESVKTNSLIDVDEKDKQIFVNSFIDRILCVKNAALATEIQLCGLIHRITKIYICGIHKTDTVCYVLFKDVNSCLAAIKAFSETRSPPVLNKRFIYFEKFTFDVILFTFRNMDDVFLVKDFETDSYYAEQNYCKVEVKNEKLVEQIKALKAELAKLKNTMKKHAYKKRRVESSAKEGRIKKFEELREKCIQELKNFKF